MTVPLGSKRARSGEFDMAILDVMLPKMNGFECCGSLREKLEAARANADRPRG
jgi:DNA-binding response OmpR family regulator